ncbi:MAG TPA: PKD domain-containing protein [Candidatus Saccharimonadales bacterium]|nr:PKD domain-containing protein [Candidatus Saccharimonadales bacterium]
MRSVSHVFHKNSKKLSFVAGLAVAVVGILGSAAFTANKAGATGVDCDNNSIIKCGYTTPSNFISKVKANSSGNGHNDLQAVYNYYGLSAADYNNFAAHALPGKAMRNGDIVLNDGTKVATGGKSIGRIASYHGTGYFTQPINGVNYYGNVVDKTFSSGVQSIPVYILFDSTGTMKFAVMTSCGNPSFGTVVKTSAACSVLNSAPVRGQPNTYDFTAAAAHTGNATIKTYVYDFGDGSPTITTTDGSKPVRHAYSKMGNWTASVTVYASVPGNSNMKLPSVSMCTKKITVEMPACVQLVGAILDKHKMEYTFTVTAKPGTGATFTGADFDFGDGLTQTGVKPASATTATVTHSYAEAGHYDAGAILHFNMNGADVTAPTCKALVTPETVTPECKPGVPVGSAECTPCQYDSSLPSDSPKCVPPTSELPNTGAGNTIAIFAVVMIGGFLVYRQLLFKKHRAAFAAAEQGTSPLPLGDPLNQEAPLAGTPLQAKSKSLRRRRLF